MRIPNSIATRKNVDVNSWHFDKLMLAREKKEIDPNQNGLFKIAGNSSNKRFADQEKKGSLEKIVIKIWNSKFHIKFKLR